MGRRAAAYAGTRRRILEATMAVHAEQGIVAGHWPDIAARAGVSLATLYRHFPTLEDLAIACGALTMERVAPPAPGDAPAVFAGASGRRARLARLARAIFGFYERAGRVVDNVRRDRTRLAVLERAHARFEAALAAFVREALRPQRASAADRRTARAIIDVRVWEALREQGHTPEDAVRIGARLLSCALRHARPSK